LLRVEVKIKLHVTFVVFLVVRLGILFPFKSQALRTRHRQAELVGGGRLVIVGIVEEAQLADVTSGLDELVLVVVGLLHDEVVFGVNGT